MTATDQFGDMRPDPQDTPARVVVERGGDVADVPESYRLATEPDVAPLGDHEYELGELAEQPARPAAPDDTGPAGMLEDVEHGLALVVDADGDRWVRRPDGEYEAIGGPVFPFAELARRHGPLQLVDYTPAPAGPARPPRITGWDAEDGTTFAAVHELAADPDPYAALVRLVELIAAGRPGGRLAPGDVTACAAGVARVAAAARGGV